MSSAERLADIEGGSAGHDPPNTRLLVMRGNVTIKHNWNDPTLEEALQDTTDWANGQQLEAQKALAFGANILMLQEYEHLWAKQRRQALMAWRQETPQPSHNTIAQVLGISRTAVTRLLKDK